MAKTISIVGLFLLLVSCKPQENCPADNNQDPDLISKEDHKLLSSSCPQPNDPNDGSQDPPTDPEDGPADEIPSEAFLFDANFALTDFDSKDEVKVSTAIEIIKKVIRTDEFRSRVLNFTYNGEKKFINSDGLTNEQIYQKLLDGAEDLRPEVDHEMDLDLELYYSNRSTVGYTYASGLRIWMNKKFFNIYTPAEVAGNIFHEWTHKLGFKHASNYSLSRESSVPYALGYLVEELGKKIE